MRRQGFMCAVFCSLMLMGIEACHRVDENDTSTPVSVEMQGRGVSTVDPSPANAFEQEAGALEASPGMEQDIDNLWKLFPGEPQRSFRRGREDFLAKKYRTAAGHIQKSTIYVKLQSLRAFGTTKRALLDSEADLSKLAKDVEKGKVSSLGRLDTTFATAQRTIARLHHEKAMEAYTQGDLRAAGGELQAAKESLARAAAWTGDHVDPTLMDSLDRAENDGKRLMMGSNPSPAATRKTLSDVGAQIDRLDKKADLEDTWALFIGETEFYLRQAQRRFENRDMKGAAGNMRRAGACMAVEAFGSFGDAKGILEKEMAALGKTAEEVETGALKSAKKLQRCFAAVQYGLARVHHIKASRYDSQHYYNRAVSALRAAATDLERAVSWEGKSMKNSSARLLQDIKDMSRRMREGHRVAPEEITEAVLKLNKAIDRQEERSVSP